MSSTREDVGEPGDRSLAKPEFDEWAIVRRFEVRQPGVTGIELIGVSETGAHGHAIAGKRAVRPHPAKRTRSRR